MPIKWPEKVKNGSNWEELGKSGPNWKKYLKCNLLLMTK